MSIVNQEKIAAASAGFKAVFADAFAKAPAYWKTLATIIESNSSEETYTWLGPAPKMKEWIGERTLRQLVAYAYTVKNRRWANGIVLDETDLADDKLGVMGKKVQMLAEMAARHYDELLVSLLVSGFTNLCYDGQFFFDTDHKDGAGPVQSNRQSGVLSALNYNAAYQKMLEIKDEDSEPMGSQPSHLVCGPSNRATALGILKAERDAAGASNINVNSAELIISPRITGAHWFLLDLNKPIGPLILQIRQAVEFAAADRPGSEARFMRGQLLYGAEGRHNAGYGLWQFAVGSDGT
jgi:phage major head subunit gpT-like protein